MKKPELLAPAGSMESLYAAIEGGCDAVYLSGYMFGARKFAPNFSQEELVSAIKLCHMYGIKVYVTVNTLIYEEEVQTFLEYIDFLHQNNVDAVLIQDIGMLDLVRQTYPNLEVHASTQMHIHNLNGIHFCEKMGIKRAVLARETSIDTIQEIRKNTDIELEVFVHGALCISYSGQCLMSSMIGGRSGNRGACAGSCRLPYQIIDEQHNRYNKGDYPLSTKDLNTLSYLDQLLKAGVDSLKIEGRMKRPEYVYLVVSLYRKAIDSYYAHGKAEITDEDIKNLKKVFNREFTKGFLFHEKMNNYIQDYRPNHLGIKIGKVLDYHRGKVTVKLTDTLTVGDGIRLLEQDIGCTITNLFKDHQKIKSGKENDIISFYLEGKVSKGDTLVKTTDKEQLENIECQINAKKRKVNIKGKIVVKKGIPLTLSIDDGKNLVEIKKELVEAAMSRPLTREQIVNQINRLGNTIYHFEKLDVQMDDDCYVNIKTLNEIRREAIQKLNDLRCYQINYHKQDYQRSVPKYSVAKEVSFLAANEQLYNLVAFKDNTVYIEDEDLWKKVQTDPHVILKLPRVSEKGLKKECPVMIGELGGLVNSQIEVSDFSLNVVNSYSVALLHSLGVKKVTLSYEMNFEQVKNMIKAYKERYEALPNVEIIGYSKVEVMVSKYDIYENYHTNKSLFLVDKFHNKYEIKKRDGLTYIINYKTTILENTMDYYKIGVNSIRYQLLTMEDYQLLKEKKLI